MSLKVPVDRLQVGRFSLVIAAPSFETTQRRDEPSRGCLPITEADSRAILDRIEATTDFEIPEPGRFSDIVSGGSE